LNMTPQLNLVLAVVKNERGKYLMML